MSTQRYISTSFWDDEWVQTLNLMEKGLYLYFLSNTLTNIAGIYKISDRRILFDTGLSDNKFREIFDKFEKAGKAYRHDEYIIIPKWPKHQKWETHSKIKDGIISVLQDLPKELLKKLYEVDYEFDLSLIDKTIIAYKMRQGISGGKAKKVFEKSDYKCAICGEKKKLVIHHKLSIKEGGDNHIDNLQAICEDCHGKIHSPDSLSEILIPYMDDFSPENQSEKVPYYSDSDSDSDIDSDSDMNGVSGEPPQSMKDAIELSNLLLASHRLEIPDYLSGKKDAKTIQRWAADIEKLIRLDKKSPDVIRQVIQWVKTPGNFWFHNIESGAKLRKQFERLFGEMNSKRSAIKT